jgi:Family of unknown function (DUF5519)
VCGAFAGFIIAGWEYRSLLAAKEAQLAAVSDLPFPVKVRDELIAAGKAERHHVLPNSGWVSCWIGGVEDVRGVVELFHLNYERPWSNTPREAA